jgi:hypothetical protein
MLRMYDVFITFLNGEQITQADNLNGVDDDVKASVAVGIRVACKLFPILEISNHMSLRSFREHLGSNQMLCDLPTVMKACSLHLQATKTDLVWVSLVLDEAHFAESPEAKSAPRLWTAMMVAMMAYVIPSNDTSPGVTDSVVVFPMIASTWSVERQKYHWTPGTKVFPPLPALSMDSVDILCKDVIAKNAAVGVLWKDVRFRHFLP